MNDIESYIFGLLVTDGSLYLSKKGSKGRVTLEVNSKDSDIIYKLYNIIPNSSVRQRIRNTNFKNNYKTKIFSNSRKEFREFLILNGFPVFRKSENVGPPNSTYDELHFWRGVIDGDGSIGITSKNIPFISFVTVSENLKNSYVKFIEKTLNRKIKTTRNKRDNAYNIMISGKDAIILTKILYIDNNNGLYLERKYKKALDLQNYNKPNMSNKIESFYRSKQRRKR